MYINNLGHMTKMAAMPIYGKNPSNIFFSETNRLISMKLGVKHPWLKYYNIYRVSQKKRSRYKKVYSFLNTTDITKIFYTVVLLL